MAKCTAVPLSWSFVMIIHVLVGCLGRMTVPGASSGTELFFGPNGHAIVPEIALSFLTATTLSV